MINFKELLLLSSYIYNYMKCSLANYICDNCLDHGNQSDMKQTEDYFHL